MTTFPRDFNHFGPFAPGARALAFGVAPVTVATVTAQGAVVLGLGRTPALVPFSALQAETAEGDDQRDWSAEGAGTSARTSYRPLAPFACPVRRVAA